MVSGNPGNNADDIYNCNDVDDNSDDIDSADDMDFISFHFILLRRVALQQKLVFKRPSIKSI